MGQVQEAYLRRFRNLLSCINCRRLDLGCQRLIARADRLADSECRTWSHAADLIEQQLQTQIRRHPHVGPQLVAGFIPEKPSPGSARPIRFFCDAGLGGLARWLRAAGYEAFWREGICDVDLLHEARRCHAVILTTDGRLMECGLLRDGELPALWLSPEFRVEEQLQKVFRVFGLELRPTRCMNCGGELEHVDKETIKGRIPPRTLLWLNDYQQCRRCAHVFWQGTHWDRIQSRLASLPRPAVCIG